MKLFVRRSLRAIVVGALCTFTNASDWYVDAVNGSDANSGTSAASAWKTITFALANAPAGAQTIHVLPGTYDAANGETFPLTPAPDFAVVGDAGAAQTIVNAGATTGGVFRFVALTAGAPSFGPATRVSGLSLRGSDSGVRIDARSATISPTLTDLDVSQTVNGLHVIGGVASAGVFGSTQALIERVDVHGCTRGLRCENLGTNAAFTLTARDSNFVDNSSRGVDLLQKEDITLVFERCRIDDNVQHGVYSDISGPALSVGLFASFRDCSLSANGSDGWSSRNTGSPGARILTFTRCTIANNGHVGVNLYDDCFELTDYATLDHCIVASNPNDIEVQSFACETPTLERCCVGDGSYVSGNGSFTANPSFVNAAAGDFRLKWASPCIDAATSAPPAGALDLAGHARDVDGDLNTSEVSDLGAFEFRPLELIGTGELNTLLQWELWGPQGNATKLYWTRVALPGSATSTPFGDLDLDPLLASVFRVTTVGAATPTVIQRSIPNAVSLVGRTFAFQALTDNAAAPSGKAYTNAVQVTIVP